MRKTCFLSLVLVLAVEANCRGDLQVQTYEPNRQDRFYVGADKDFLGQSFDWSGVGQANNGTWATMISPTYFVSAAHYHPSGGNTLTFCQGNDPAGPSYQFTVSSWGFQASFGGVPSDLWLGKLDAPIPANDHINYYAVPALQSDSDYVGQLIYVNGKPNRVGRNIIDRITTAQEPDPPAAPYKNTVTMEYDYNSTSGLGADECYLIPGDSGGPSFIDVNGKLGLVGIHYYNGGTPGPQDIGLISGDSFVPFYIDQLNANMAGESVTVVPEPANWKGPGGGSFNLASNWMNNSVPNGVDAIANFLGNILAPSTITLDSPVTLGTLNINSSQTCTIVGASILTLQVSSGTASVNVLAGIHEISVPIAINSDTVINGAGILDLSGGISGNHTLTILDNLTATSIQVNTLTIGTTGAMAVPEPSMFVLLGMCAFGMLAWAWQRNR